MNQQLQKWLPHLLVTLFFIAASLLYFAPVLQGKMIYQSDIVQYTGMAKEQNEYRAATGEEPYWTDSAFGGMPTYQLGADYPYNFIKKLIRLSISSTACRLPFPLFNRVLHFTISTEGGV